MDDIKKDKEFDTEDFYMNFDEADSVWCCLKQIYYVLNVVICCYAVY